VSCHALAIALVVVEADKEMTHTKNAPIKKPRRTPKCCDGAGTEKRPMFTWGGIIDIRQLPSANRQKELSM
jgi:hypothetical protein